MLELSPLFSDGMILPRGKQIRISGRSEGEVTVAIADEECSLAAHGAFCAHLPELEAGGPFTLTVRTDTEEVSVRDVYVGETYLLAGQSNAQFTLSGDMDYETVPHADELARCFEVPRPDGVTPITGKWVPQSEKTAEYWSALAFHTARLLRQKLGIPIGIVCAAQGAAVIQSFLSEEGAAAFRFEKSGLHPDHTSERFGSWNPPSYIYDRMIQPLYPLALTGAVWYQGESNTSPAEGARYGEMLHTFINETRAGFQDADLPFVIVQINDFDTPFSQKGWQRVQRAQEDTVRETKHAALVRLADLGYHDMIHPINKREAAERVAAAILKLR